MTSNIVNQMPFLRTSRDFSEEGPILNTELNKMYLDVASVVNNRTIGLYPTNRPAINGESWFLTGPAQKQQGLRQVYTFTATTAIDHNIQVTDPGQFINCYGSYTDGTNCYGLFFASSVAIAGQITFYVTATQVIFAVGGGAPALVSGMIVLQWLANT
jgi:hypothetical protein